MAEQSPYSEVSDTVKKAMDELNQDESQYIPTREAEELFNLPDKVQIFFVSPEGRVSTFSEPSSLRIFKFKDSKEGDLCTTFIQVNGWTHPLIAGASPVLEAANGAIMFPDVYAEVPGSSVGLVLAEDVEQEIRDTLRAILNEYTALKVEEKLPQDQQLGTIGRTLVSGAEYLCKGMDFSSKKACALIEYVGDQAKSKYPEAESEAKVSPAWKYTAKGAMYATKATVKVSGFVANRVGKLTKGTADYLAKKLDKPVSGVVTSATGGSKPSKSSSMHNIVDAARGGLIAFGTVYSGLEDSAKVLGSSVKSQSVNVVQHRYGQEAGLVYGDAMTAAGNAAMTYMNVTSLGVKGIAKKTAKETAKQVGRNVLEAHVVKQGKIEQQVQEQQKQ